SLYQPYRTMSKNPELLPHLVQELRSVTSSINDLLRRTSVLEQQIADALASAKPVAAEPARYSIKPTAILVPLQAEGAKLPVFCPHPGDGMLRGYAELAKLLGARPVVGL